jgi:hypothetical protein
VNAIGNFYPDAVVREVMLKFIEQNPDIDVDSSGTTEQIAVGLSIRFQEKLSRDDMCKCDRCAGEAPDTLEACPFCGLGGEVTPGDVAESPEPRITEDAAGGTNEQQNDASGSTGGETSAPAKKKKSSSKKDKKKEGGEATAEQEQASTDAIPAEVVSAEPPKEDEDMRAAAAAKVTPGDQKLVQVQGKGAAMKPYTTKDLDDAVKDVLEAKASTFVSSIELGTKILDINVRQLWKLRVDAKGKAKYTSFDAFLHHELKISDSMAYSLMGMARKYGNDAAARKIGATKFTLILKAPPEDREALKQDAVDNNLSKRELEKKVQDAKKKRGYTGETEKARAGAKGAEAKAAKKAAAQKAVERQSDKITIAVVEGRKTVKLYAKPASLRNLDMNDLKRAKTLDAMPFGRFELGNETVLYLSIQKTDQGLVSVLDFRREASAAAE